MDVALRRFIEGRGHDFALGVTPEIGDFLRPLVDQQEDQFHLRTVRGDRVRDVLQQDGLARARWRDNQAPLPKPDWRQNVDRPHRDVLAMNLRFLEQDTLQRVIGHQFLKGGHLRDGVRRTAHHRVDSNHRRTALAFLRRLNRHLDPMTALEPVAGDQALGQVRILGIEPVVDVLMDDEGPAIRQVDITAVAQGAFLVGRKLEYSRKQLPPVRRTLERHAGAAGELRQLRQRPRINLI